MTAKNLSSEEKELNTWCKVVCDLAKVCEDDGDNVLYRQLFAKAVRDAWMLKLFPKHLASKKAYQDFKKKTAGLDIRNCNWFSKEKITSNEKIYVHSVYEDEHLTTVKDFKEEILFLQRKGKLTEAKVKELFFQQRVCWITKDEDKKLNKKGFYQHRQDPLEAYDRCGIVIYDEDPANLSDVMKPTYK